MTCSERGSPSLAFQNKVGRKERTEEEVEKEGSRGRREERGAIIILLSDAAFALPPSLGPGDSSPSLTEERGLLPSDPRTLPQAMWYNQRMPHQDINPHRYGAVLKTLIIGFQGCCRSEGRKAWLSSSFYPESSHHCILLWVNRGQKE